MSQSRMGIILHLKYVIFLPMAFGFVHNHNILSQQQQ